MAVATIHADEKVVADAAHQSTSDTVNKSTAPHQSTCD